jgi:hypothetical protein
MIVPGLFVVAVLCPKTPYALPVGVQLNVFAHTTILIGIGSGRTVQFDNGSVGAIFVTNQLAGFSYDYILLDVVNDQNGSTWATASTVVDVGELWFGSLDEFKLSTDPKIDLIDPTLMRRSHSNQPWPLFIKPYNQWTFNFTPMNNTKAYDSSSIPSFASVRYAISQAQCALVLPRIYTPGTNTINAIDLAQLTCFGKPDSVGPLAGVKDGPLWTATMTFGEAPP